jgi:membrane dipeptidase
MNLSLFDTHCDTAFELYRRNEELQDNTCHISLSNAQKYDKYVQLFAIWSDRRLDDQTCWEDFLKIADNFDRLIEHKQTAIKRVRTASALQSAISEQKRAAVLAVEDARLLLTREI